MSWDGQGRYGMSWVGLGWAELVSDWLGWAGLDKAGLGCVGVDCAVQGWDGWDGVGGSLMEVCWAIGSPECVSSSRGCCSWCSSCTIAILSSLLHACLFPFSVSNIMTGAEQSHLRTVKFSF